jgi:hypothetical protein
MKRILFTFLAVVFFAGAAFAQEITDEEKRDFDDFTPIRIDVDGDGKLDKITPRVYQINTKKGSKNKRDTKNWIAFDLITSRGQTVKSFFKYNYGDAEASYWIYVLKAAGDINRDGKVDLIFYTGDDTSDETVWLANNGKGFTVLRRKTSDNNNW